MKKILFIGVIFLLFTLSVFSQSKRTWEKTEVLNTTAAYEEFITQYPAGKYTELAKKKLSDLKAQLAKEAEKEAKQKRFIDLVKLNAQNIKTGMRYSELDSLLKISDIDPWPDITASMMKPSGLISTTSYAMSLAGYLYLKFENGILKEWHIIQQ